MKSLRLKTLGLTGRCVLLLVAVAGLFPLIAAWHFSQHGSMGLVAVAVAAVVCGLSSLAALVVTLLPKDPLQSVSGVLLGMMIEMGVPMLAGLALQKAFPALAAAGLFGAIVVFFLWSLLVNKLLAVTAIQSRLAAKADAGKHAVKQ